MSPRETFILHVDHDANRRRRVAEILTAAGHSVREASSGAEALRVAREGASVVVLDLGLPDVSGLDVCRALKSDPVTAAISVLQTSSASVTVEQKIAGIEAGADGMLAHPIEPPELIATIGALLRARRAEDASRRSAEDWQRTFEALGDAVAVVQIDGRVTRLNPAMQRLVQLPADATPEERDQALDALFPRGIGLLLESLSVTRSRQMVQLSRADRTLRVVLDPVWMGHDAFDRVVVVISDVTDQKRFEEQQRRRTDELAADARRKDEFLAMLAHELRNPLHAISTAVQLQARLDADDPRNAELRHTIVRQTGNLSRMVDDLLNVSRVTRGRISLHLERLDLRDCIDHALEVVGPLVPRVGPRIEWRRPNRPFPIMGDALRLEQALTNVMSNAIKYAPGTASVDLELTADGAHAVLKVIDRGIGIPPSMLSDIFELFVQVEPHLSRAQEGLGIGLTVSRSLVQLHGGRLDAHSEGVGLGCTVTLRLPLEGSGQPASPSLAFGSTSIPPLRILVVEDNPDARFVLRSLLDSMGHDVVEEGDGQRGLDRLRSERFDVALIDIGLPLMDGYQVVEAFRAYAGEMGPLLVAVTGYGQGKDRDRALSAGFDDHVVKPVSEAVLADILAQAARLPA
jgi:signal transduction histidine kinase